MEDLSVVWMLFLKWISKISVKRASNGLTWLRIRTTCGMSRSLCSVFGFHTVRGISSLAKGLLAFKKDSFPWS